MDDEEPIRRVGARLLQHFGCTVATAPDGQAAVDQYRAAREQGTPFAAVIMDLTIPGGMGGREALEHLRAADPDVKAIVSSGYSSDPILANFRDYGFCGRVAKPYQPSELYAVLRDVIAER
jgi:CheY-like chemotaxis protein